MTISSLIDSTFVLTSSEVVEALELGKRGCSPARGMMPTDSPAVVWIDRELRCVRLALLRPAELTEHVSFTERIQHAITSDHKHHLGTPRIATTAMNKGMCSALRSPT